MTLSTRLSMFFLSMLALVLAGFSITLYTLAQNHLRHQGQERLEGALNTLVAAVEVGPEGLEWEKTQHKLDLGLRHVSDQVVWLISGDKTLVDSAGSEDLVKSLSTSAWRLEEQKKTRDNVVWQDQPWLVGQRWLDVHAMGKPAPEPPPPVHPGEKKYQQLFIAAAVPLGPARAELAYLAGILGGLSVLIWLAALVSGRYVCRQALLPVQRMAQSARDMEASDLTERLPVAATGDELEDLSRSFNGLLERTQESLERQRRFAGDASHQLRTPLTALLGQLEIALRRDRSGDEYRQVLATAQRQGKHLQQIIESLLFLARTDAEARLPNLEPIDLAAWLAERGLTWAGMFAGRELRWEIDQPGPCWVEAQTALLEELVKNLLENAAKYSPDGAVITLTLIRENSEVVLAVEDEGTGLHPEDLPHLFEPFFRSAAARARGIGGAGLGLAIAARIALGFGGRIDAENRPAGGSCFKLRLPALDQEGREKISTQPVPSAAMADRAP